MLSDRASALWCPRLLHSGKQSLASISALMCAWSFQCTPGYHQQQLSHHLLRQSSHHPPFSPFLLFPGKDDGLITCDNICFMHVTMLAATIKKLRGHRLRYPLSLCLLEHEPSNSCNMGPQYSANWTASPEAGSTLHVFKMCISQFEHKVALPTHFFKTKETDSIRNCSLEHRS